MNFVSVIDTSAFIWDTERLKTHASTYYELSKQLKTFFKVIEREKPKILLRQKMYNEMINGFPYADTTQDHYDWGRVVSSFLSKIAGLMVWFPEQTTEGFSSRPNLVYDHYNATVQEETRFLITYIHNDEGNTVFLTFQPIWDNNGQLVTLLTATERQHETIISGDEELERFFEKHKPKFEHNPKHDRIKKYAEESGEDVSKLSSYDGRNNDPAQAILEKSIPFKTSKKRYGYDTVNNTYVCFHPHSENRYHGWDVVSEKVPIEVKRTFGKRR